MPKLMWLFLIPLIASVITFIGYLISIKNMKPLAIVLSLLPLIALIIDPMSWIGEEVKYAWIPALSIDFYLSVDSLSLLFLCLTIFIVPVSLFAAPDRATASAPIFYTLIFLLESLLIGFFTARDLALFTLFWEAILLPLYLIISYWGGIQRQAIALKFLIYMIAGSALMIAAVLALYFLSEANTFDINILSPLAPHLPHAAWLCAIFMLAFAVKTPLFPFHAWLPDAYCQAPTSGTILLAALLSKAGVYGILRIGYGMFAVFIQSWSPMLLGLAISGIFYGGLAAWRQRDFKRLLAYASFSHLNFILAGLFIWDRTAHIGAILQAINHGVTIAALFIVAGWLEKRLGSTDMQQSGGLAKFFPYLCWVSLIFALSYMALPGTNNFIGELLILFGMLEMQPMLAILLGFSLILTAVYMLQFMQKIYFEVPIKPQPGWQDLNIVEMTVALSLAAYIFWIGIYPLPVLTKVELALDQINYFNTLKDIP